MLFTAVGYGAGTVPTLNIRLKYCRQSVTCTKQKEVTIFMDILYGYISLRCLLQKFGKVESSECRVQNRTSNRAFIRIRSHEFREALSSSPTEVSNNGRNKQTVH